jgi:hypothetical protein
VSGKARAVLRADAADFHFIGCQLEVSTNESVRHIPGCVDDYAQGLRLKAFQYLNVMWILFPRVGGHKSRLVGGWFCREGACCVG